MPRGSTLTRFLRAQLGASPKRKPNPWPKCPPCGHRVPALCPGTDTEPCGFCPETCCPGHLTGDETGDDTTRKWGDR